MLHEHSLLLLFFVLYLQSPFLTLRAPWTELWASFKQACNCCYCDTELWQRRSTANWSLWRMRPAALPPVTPNSVPLKQECWTASSLPKLQQTNKKKTTIHTILFFKGNNKINSTSVKLQTGILYRQYYCLVIIWFLSIVFISSLFLSGKVVRWG